MFIVCDPKDCGNCDCEQCPIPSAATIRRERMIRDDETQPLADEPYSEQFWDGD